MEIIGKVLGINTSDGMMNLLVVDAKKEQYNIKSPMVLSEVFLIGHIYQFIVDRVVAERVSYQIKEVYDVDQLEPEKSDMILRDFMAGSPLSLEESRTRIYENIEKIENEIIRTITKSLVDQYSDKFFIYPAATRMHHAYIGGLAYHCLGMIQMADSFMANYPYLKKDYLYAGILLHDIGKTIELTGPQNTEYTLSGQLLGHLVIGALEIEKVAASLGYENSKEVLLLKHMLISHHGQPQFGAAKKPCTPEALVLWYIDTIDSKFRVLGEELSKTEDGCYTDSIGVLDKMKIYKG